MTRRMRSMNDGRPARVKKPAAFAGGLLALALAAGCGSSGGGKVAGGPASSTPSTPSSTPSSASTDFPGPSSSVSDSPSASPTTLTDPLRDFHDTASGVSLTAPVGYVVAATPAEAASRFPSVLGAGAASKITEAQTRLRSTTIMVAYHAPIGGLFDNIGVIKAVDAAPSDPAQIQSPSFQAQFRTSLTGAGAKTIVFTDTKLGGQPAENATYTIPSGTSTVFGQQFYVANTKDVFVVTVTAGTAARAEDAANEIADTWSFD